MKGLDRIFLVLAIVTVLSSFYASAQPFGVTDISEGASSRYSSSATPTQVNAQAGNVTELSINATAVTTSWQGYYGNITGNIILADASGNNFYNWSITQPSGEVYASRNDSITWTGINCSQAADVATEEAYLGQQATDPDSVSNTFVLTTHPAFFVGAKNMTGCYSTHAYDSTGGQGTGFWQVLLTDTQGYTVYTSVIDSSVQTGFNNRPWQFELLVGENGKVGNEGITPYYFYVELQ